ncbi:MAG: arylamine N-acetyltransferase [Gammaproteobacteria bacterium]|nr:arylamine N-acetyltransferase [Gammaproteobacteria bacterium]
MDLSNYFERIGYSGSGECTLATLQELHKLHPAAIPFENLTSFLAVDVSLIPGKVFTKLVDHGRGGYCFEHNLVFATVLKRLGFTVTEHAARVIWRSPNKTQMARTHMLLKVMVNNQAWIADVGFGGITMTAPLKLEKGIEQQSPHENFMITCENDEYTISAKLGNNWQSLYVFDLVQQYPVDFDMANFFVSSHPESLFRHNLMLGRPEAQGRHALLNRDYSYYSLEGEKTQRRISDSDELIDILTGEFGIQLEGSIDIQALRNKFEKLD